MMTYHQIARLFTYSPITDRALLIRGRSAHEDCALDDYVIEVPASTDPMLKWVFEGAELHTDMQVLVHGSWGDQSKKPFSDLDDLVIVDDEVLSDGKKLKAAHKWLRMVELRMQTLDPLQHHGHWLILKSELSTYDEGYMPLAVLRDAVSIRGPVAISARSGRFDDGAAVNILNAVRHLDFNHKKYLNRSINYYSMKELVSGILLMPAYAYQALGQQITKRSAIETAANVFGHEALSVVTTASEIRARWLDERRHHTIIYLLGRSARAFRFPTLFRAAVKRMAPRFPVDRSPKIDPTAMALFIEESLNYANSR